MKNHLYAIIVFWFIFFRTIAQDIHTERIAGLGCDYDKLKSRVCERLQISKEDSLLFFKYKEDDVATFFWTHNREISDSSDLENFNNLLEDDLVSGYPIYQNIKDSLINLQPAPLVVNGPCNNMDFETGTTTGWQGLTASACTTSTVPCNQVIGFSATRHVITTRTTMDPYIPTLSTVAPGGNFSVRVEDYLSGQDAGLPTGGNASLIRQTFLVTPSNNLFTYQYAAVLEDPGDHLDSERPYFKVRLYDERGAEIPCASYTVIAKPPLQNFLHVEVNNPNRGRNGQMDLYYRNWATVSIPLTAYMGQNVTAVFMASDCSRGGHMAYAYVDAKCEAIDPPQDTTICGNTPKTLTGPNGFASYRWTGPGIIGSTTQRTVTFNRPGRYVVTLTPFSDDPCPISMDFNVIQVCPLGPVKDTLCETARGTGRATGVNLNSYNSSIIAAHTNVSTPFNILSWHSARPASAANRITPPTNVSVANSQRFYAVTSLPDTVELNFLINSIPVVSFPAISSICEGASPFQITNVTPVGGTFSGTNVSSTGLFTPTVAGTYPVKYKYTNAAGCTDSVTQTVTIVKPATVLVSPMAPLCASVNTVNVSGTSTNTSGVLWSGGSGSFSNTNTLTTTYTPTSAEKNSTNPVVLTLTGTAQSPCPAVRSTVSVSFVPVPLIDIVDVSKLCMNIDSVVLSATSRNLANVLWSGGLGSFRNTGSLSTVYYPTAGEKSSANGITLTLTGQGNTPCPSVQDQTKLTFAPLASVAIPLVSPICNTTDSVRVIVSAQNTTAVAWSGGSGRFSKNDALQTHYYPSQTEKNNAGAISLFLLGTAQSPCPQVRDTVEVSLVKAPSVSAVDLPVFCNSTDSVLLDGVAHNAASTTWSGGAGVFKNAASVSTTYFPTSSEKNNTTGLTLTLVAQGNSPCPAIHDTIRLSFVPTATVTVPAVPAICNTTDSVQIKASSQNTTALTWSGGAGRFSQMNTLNTYYNPSQAEKSSANAIALILTGTAQSPCPQVRDTVEISLVKAPSVSAVDMPFFCTTIDSVRLSGLAQDNLSASWTGGTGVFKDAASANTVYYPSAADKSASPIMLRFTAVAHAPCISVSDTISLRIVQKPFIQLQPSAPICATANSLPVTWLSQNVQSLQWTVAGTLNVTGISQANYLPTADEKASSIVRILVDATGYSPCPNMRDTLEVAVVQPPQVQTTALQPICSSTDSVALRATQIQTQKVMWLGGNGGVFDHKDSIATAYHLSAIDKTKDSLMFYFFGIANAPCFDTKDSVLLRLVALPAIDALELGPFCEDVDSIGLKVSADHLRSVSWSSVAGGSFKNPQAPVATYFPSSSEKKSGQTIIRVIGEALAPCTNINDSVRIQYIPQAIVVANATGPFCADVDKVQLSGTALNTSGVRWYVGAGSLSNRDLLNTNYLPSATERKGANIMARLVGFGTAPCKNVEDTIVVKLHPLPSESHTELSFCNDDNTTALLDAGIATHYSWLGLGDTTRYVRVPNAGAFNVQVKNQFGCVANRTVETTIECPPRLFVSNAFSPNGDGINDKYTVYHIHIGKYQMLIFNRWGEIIYESQNPEEAWDGNYRGESMPIGVYEWVITYEGDSKKYRGPYSLKGSVTVVR